jgi:hypothetical protein
VPKIAEMMAPIKTAQQTVLHGMPIHSPMRQEIITMFFFVFPPWNMINSATLLTQAAPCWADLYIPVSRNKRQGGTAFVTDRKSFETDTVISVRQISLAWRTAAVPP